MTIYDKPHYFTLNWKFWQLFWRLFSLLWIAGGTELVMSNLKAKAKKFIRSHLLSRSSTPAQADERAPTAIEIINIAEVIIITSYCREFECNFSQLMCYRLENGGKWGGTKET